MDIDYLDPIIVKYNIPYDLKPFIFQFIDYKNTHKEIFSHVLNDIKNMSSIFSNYILNEGDCVILYDFNLPPHIAYECWGNGWFINNHIDLDTYTQLMLS